MTTHRSSWIRRALRRLADRGGNVAITVALAMPVLSFSTLAAIDLARAASAKVQLQDALDVAALGAARATGSSDAALQETGKRLLQQNLGLGTDFELVGSTFRFTPDGKVAAWAQVQVEPYVAGLIGTPSMKIATSTEVVRAGMQLEIALVLDNTGSMNQNGKLDYLKAAAKDFVTAMETAASKNVIPNAIKISLVPFSHTVRVNPDTYGTAAWLDQNGSSPINNEIFTTETGTQWANRLTLLSQLGQTWGGCVEYRQAPYDIQDTPPSTSTPATLVTPYFAPDEPDVKADWFFDKFNNNYIYDGMTSGTWRVRQGAVGKYVKSSINGGKGPNRGCSIHTLMRLTTDFNLIRNEIGKLNADGSTNIPMGLAWGWFTLSPTAPFGDGVPYRTEKHKKIVVLMTDGENTILNVDTPNGSDYTGIGYARLGRVLQADGRPIDQNSTQRERTAALDDRLAKLCANMKTPAKDIEIYTIRVEVTSGESTVLENCASSADHYYDVKNASELAVVFQSIAGQIAALHLSR